ncbi:MAG: DUF3429 domain-containing protein [Pseudomonadota bacterium]
MSLPDQDRATRRSVPAAAALLGYAGLIPFLGLAAALAADVNVSLASPLFTTYSAVILSFLGGIRWGVYAGAAEPKDRDLWISIAVSLAAWAALALPAGTVVTALLGGHLATAFVDQLTPPAGQQPWLKSLRWRLSAGAIAGHLVVLFA